MKTFATFFAPVIAIALVLGFAGQAVADTVPKTIALYEDALAANITSSATSMTLVRGTDKEGTSISGTYGFIIDEGTAAEEFVIGSCTGTSCTSLSRGVSVVTGSSTVAALQKTHRRGASVKITDAPILLVLANILNGIATIPSTLLYATSPTYNDSANVNLIPSKDNVDDNYVSLGTTTAQTITGAKTFGSTVTVTGVLTTTATSTLTNGATLGYSIDAGSDDLDVANKGYVDLVGSSGTPDANTTTAGKVEEATVAEINSVASTGSTGAKLFMTPASFGASNFASSTRTYVATSTSGDLIITAIPVEANDVLMFWGNYSQNAGDSCNGSDNVAGLLQLKQSTMAATTTIQAYTNYSASSNGCSGASQGYFLATTTETVNVMIDDSSDGVDWAQLMVLKLPSF